MTLVTLLKADVARQHQFLGRGAAQASGALLLKTLLSPRFAPVLLFRLASWCAANHLRPVGKLFSLLNFTVFGLEIGLDCEIGPGLFFPHTSGTVLGARRIGRNAVIYHNVTVGAKVPDLAFKADLRPRLGDDVFLGAGSKVLGSIVLGDGVMVGANAVVVQDVPDGCLVGGIPARVLRSPGGASLPSAEG
jgi:serine O-acetyltransferase